MGIRRVGLEPNAAGPEKVSESLRKDRYVFETFMNEPLCFMKGTLTFPGGTDLSENVVNTGRYSFEYVNIGDATDAFVPVLASDGGYNWVLTTATLARGVEVNFGGLKDGHPRNHIPAGTSGEDWFTRVLLITEDASGTDIFFGFRKVAAYAETLTEYTDLSGIRIIGNSASTDADINIITLLNNAGATDYTSTASGVTGLEDATAIELEVRNVGGKAFYLVNGVFIDRATYTYDDGDVMAPVLRLLQATDISSQLKTLCYEAGPIADRTDATLLSLAGTTI